MASKYEVFRVLGSMGFEVFGQACVGCHRGYAIRVTSGSYDSCLADAAIRLDPKDKDTPRKLSDCAKQLRPRRTFMIVNKGQTVRVSVRFHGKAPLDQQVRELLDQIVSTLTAAGIPPAGTCAICGGASPESLALLNSYQPVHAGCVHHLAQDTRENVENNRLNGSYLTGFLGALLGMLVGMIPNLLAAIYTDSIFSILYALVPLAAMWGYRKLGGKIDRVSIVIVVILSLASVFLMTALTAVFQIVHEYAVPFALALSLTMDYIFSAEGFPYLLQDSLVPLFFMAIGIWISWRFLCRTGESSVRDTETVVSSLHPNPANTSAYSGEYDIQQQENHS